MKRALRNALVGTVILGAFHGAFHQWSEAEESSGTVLLFSEIETRAILAHGTWRK
jgi:hypothetical protein